MRAWRQVPTLRNNDEKNVCNIEQRKRDDGKKQAFLKGGLSSTDTTGINQLSSCLKGILHTTTTPDESLPSQEAVKGNWNPTDWQQGLPFYLFFMASRT